MTRNERNNEVIERANRIRMEPLQRVVEYHVG